jgi:capsular exopolysaccharide synthesis family protein
MLNESLIVHLEPKSPISEAYRVLRTNLQFTSVDTPLKSIAVTSAGPGEGKTTTVSNLAVAFVQSGSNVLIVDADLRKPKLHKMFGVSNKIGTTNAVVDPDEFLRYVQKTAVQGLSIMSSGPIPPNPSELLGSKNMKKLLENMKAMFDVILVDTSPVGMVTDAQIISATTDGIILVAASGKVTVTELERAKGLLQNVNANILGVILNKLEKQSNDYYYNYYYSNYQDGTSTKEKRKKRNTSK